MTLPSQLLVGVFVLALVAVIVAKSSATSRLIEDFASAVKSLVQTINAPATRG